MKVILYTAPGGNLCVVRPIINTHTLVDGQVMPVPETLTEDEAVQRAWDKLPADAVDAQIVEEAAIPADRTFRDAWTAGAGRIDHDMAKCREIHKARLRALRAPFLAALDTEYLRADEAGDIAKKAEIAAKKQALRDVTKDPAIDAAGTPEALRAVFPAALRGLQ